MKISFRKRQKAAADVSAVPKSNKKKKKITLKKLIVILVIAAVVSYLGLYFGLPLLKSKESDTVITGTKAEKGDISVTISSTGTVAPLEQYDIVSNVQGDVLYDEVSVGTTVEKGQLLYKIDSSSAEKNIEKAQNSLKKQQSSYEQTVDGLKNLKIYSPIKGVITSLYVKNGDTINSGAKIADIINYSDLIIKVPFHAEDAKDIYVGESASINLEATDETLTGKVTSVPDGSYINSSGLSVTDIEVSFTNPGAVKADDQATVQIGGYACAAVSKISYGDSQTVTSKASGEISGLSIKAGDRISQDQLMFSLKNDDLTNNIESGYLSLQDAKLSLADVYDNLDKYNITSPISGTILSKKVKSGDTLDDNMTTLAVVADMSKLTFTMNIDELDIKSVSVGQEVVITADALENQSFTGYIDSISVLGTTTSGVTTYPVKVIIENYGDLMPGMNVNADIISQQVTDVVKIPVSAISRGDVVLVKDDSAKAASSGSGSTKANGGGSSNADAGSKTSTGSASSASGGKTASNKTSAAVGSTVEMPNTPDGYKYIKVETGLSDGDYIEITAGLSEGDTVYTVTKKVTKTTTTTSSTTNTRAMTGGMDAGMAGGAPGGGFGLGM